MSETFIKTEAPRTTLKAFVVRALAVVGAWTLLMAGVTEAAQYLTRNGPTGIVKDESDARLAGVAVFLDRQSGVIERYVTDSAGRFFLKLREDEIDHAVYLICAPGLVPRVASRHPNLVGPSTYGLRKASTSEVSFSYSDWSAPVPPECPPHDDSRRSRPPPLAGAPLMVVPHVEKLGAP